MTLPPEELAGLPLTRITRTGETQYLNPYQRTYTPRRAYARRMQSGFRRGLTQQQARRNVTGYAPGVSEYQIRREREREKYQQLPPNVPLYQFNFEQRYGFSYLYWRRLRRRYIQEINQRAWHNPPSNRMNIEGGQRRDPRVFPGDIAEVKRLYDAGNRDPLYPDLTSWEQWAELRLAERLTAIRAYQDDLSEAEAEVVESGPAYGRAKYFSREEFWPPGGVWLMAGVVSVAPVIELWWYH